MAHSSRSMQTAPFPWKPARQRHAKLPSVLRHSLPAPQSWTFSAHSLTSAQKGAAESAPIRAYPATQPQRKPPRTFSHVAFASSGQLCVPAAHSSTVQPPPNASGS